MFERYADPARRAIFFARAVTLMNGASAIDSSNLLYGLMWEDDSRAQVLFHLREIFPMYRGCPYKCPDSESVNTVGSPPLAAESKKILARTAWEADALGSYWIDTEHLLLGTLGESSCLAAQNLKKAGITLKNARRVVKENVLSSSENRAVMPGEGLSPWQRMMGKWLNWIHRTDSGG